MSRHIWIVILCVTFGHCFEHVIREPNDRFLSHMKQVVVVLGNESVGKSTVATLLSGGNLTSIEKTGKYVIIDDKSRIASDDKLKTIIPEMILSENSNPLIFDAPGFRANIKSELKIPIKTYVKKLFDNANSLKFLFVASRDSISNEGGFDTGLAKLIKRAIDLLEDVEQNRNGIGLVVTKVEIWKTNDDSLASLERNDVEDLRVIRESLTELKNEYERLHGESVSPNDRSFYGEAIKFLEILIDKDVGKISIFRKPSRTGTIKDVPSFQIAKKSLDTLVNNNLQFITGNLSLFIRNNALESLGASIPSIFNETKSFYVNKTKTIFDLQKLRDMNRIAHDKLAQIDAAEPRMLLYQILNAINALEINLSPNVLRRIENSSMSLDLLTKTNGESLELTPDDVDNLMREILKHFKESQKWYQFLIDVQKELSKDNFSAEVIEAQRPEYDGKYAEMFAEKHTQKINADKYNLELWASKDSAEHLVVDSFEYERYLNVLRDFFNDKMKFNCSSGKLTIIGFNIYGNIINKQKEENRELMKCLTTSNELEKFALNRQDTMRIVTNANFSSSEKMRYYMIAPNLNKRMTIVFSNDIKVDLKNITIFDSNRKPIAYLWEDVRNPEYPQFVSAINSYRRFVIENLANNSRESEMRNFIKILENDDQLKEFQSIFGFVEELQILEQQYEHLTDEVSFGPFYESLIERIEKFSQRERKSENKKALNYVSAAALSKLHLINDKNEQQIDVKIEQNPRPMSGNRMDISLNTMIRSSLDLSKKFETEFLTSNALMNDEMKSMLHLFIEMTLVEKSHKPKLSDFTKLDEDKILKKTLNWRASLILIERISEIASFCSRVAEEGKIIIKNVITIPDNLKVYRNSGFAKIQDRDSINGDNCFKGIAKWKDLTKDIEAIIKRTISTIKDELVGNFKDANGDVTDVVRNHINAMQNDLKTWDGYKKRLSVITAALQINVKNVKNQLPCLGTTNGTVVELEIEKIRLSLVELNQVLREIRMTQGNLFDFGTDYYLKSFSDDLEMEIFGLIQNYKRIRSYVTLEKLKASIKYISSTRFSRVQIENAKLKDSVTEMERMIFSHFVASLN